MELNYGNLLEKAKNGEFDVISCFPSENKIVIHDARMHNDMKRQLMHHHEFEFDHIFDANYFFM